MVARHGRLPGAGQHLRADRGDDRRHLLAGVGARLDRGEAAVDARLALVGPTGWEIEPAPERGGALVRYVYRGVRATSPESARAFALHGTRFHSHAMHSDALPGIALGLWVFKTLDAATLARSFGGAVMLYGIYSLWNTFRPPGTWKVPGKTAAAIAGLCGGAVGTTFGTMASVFFAIYFDVSSTRCRSPRARCGPIFRVASRPSSSSV